MNINPFRRRTMTLVGALFSTMPQMVQCPFAGHSIGQIQSSRVKRFVKRRMAGAANSTIGSIVIQATNDDRSQWIKKVPVAMKGKLAIAAAIAQVRPD
jgi:hypothetical protein